jgi:site-specific DNA-methyltransferase (adenine-specific)
VLQPYWSDASVTLYKGDMREVLPQLDLTADCIVCDPPYGEIVQDWDRWPDGWVDVAAAATRSMWAFGSMRMFMTHLGEFARWKLSQDVIWEKNVGSHFVTDRFRRIHEHALHWYRGGWGDIHHDVPRDGIARRTKQVVRAGHTSHLGARGSSLWQDDGTRLAQSIIYAPNLHGNGLHVTQKPVAVLDPLIRYSCPPGGLVLDPFAGSGSTAEAARMSGRRCVLIEGTEKYCDVIVNRLAQDVLPLPALDPAPYVMPPVQRPHPPECQVCECGVRGEHTWGAECHRDYECVPWCPHYTPTPQAALWD